METSILNEEIVDKRPGGPKAFQIVMEKVRSGPLTGYLHSSLALKGHNSNGVIIFEAGKPIFTLYSFRHSKDKSVEVVYHEERAMESIRGDSLSTNSILELYKVKDIKDLEKVLMGARMDIGPSLDDSNRAEISDSKGSGRGQPGKQTERISDIEKLTTAILDFQVSTATEKVPPRLTMEISVVLKEGESYLIEEENREYSHGVFAYLIEQGMTGLGITRSNPKVLRSRMEKVKPTILWLTDHETKTEDTVTPSLEKIIVVIEEFMSKNESAVVLIDDLQYLISNNSFEGAVRLIRSLVDKFSEKKSIFLLSIDPSSMSTREMSIVQREMNVLHANIISPR